MTIREYYMYLIDLVLLYICSGYWAVALVHPTMVRELKHHEKTLTDMDAEIRAEAEELNNKTYEELQAIQQLQQQLTQSIERTHRLIALAQDQRHMKRHLTRVRWWGPRYVWRYLRAPVKHWTDIMDEKEKLTI